MNRNLKNAVVVEPRWRSNDHTLLLDLAGPLSLRDAEGTDLTPKARKAQGMLALIGSSPCLRRSRIWLQDKLWSDRGPEQGAGSLRQCLTEMRRSLGKHAGCMKTESGFISLDPAYVRVRPNPQRSEQWGEVEFLEGLDVRDPEFEHWLRDQRAAFVNRAASGAPDPASEPLRFATTSSAETADPYAYEGTYLETAAGYIALDLLVRFLSDKRLVDMVDLYVNRTASHKNLAKKMANRARFKLPVPGHVIRGRTLLNPNFQTPAAAPARAIAVSSHRSASR